jgi:drug/metabolite transporter (DMT)-like permease
VKQPHTLAGMALALTALACFATLDTTTKYVTSNLGVSVLMALWVRYVFQAIVTASIMLPLRGRALLRTAHPKYQALRGVLLLLTSLFAFLCLKLMPVGEFTAIVMITPLVITLLAATTLGERVSPLRWALVSGGFAGTLIIIRPGSEVFSWTMLLPLALVVTNAWFQVLTSRLARTEDPMTMHFYTGWVGALLSSLAMPFVWVLPEHTAQWAYLLLMGLLGTVGHFLLILAYRRTPATTITPLLYSQIGFALFGGWLVFSHVPDHWSLIGMAMIAGCGAAAAWLAVRESRVLIEPVEP